VKWGSEARKAPACHALGNDSWHRYHFCWLAVDFLAISDLHDQNNQFLVLNGIHDSIVAFANTVQILFAGKFLHALGPWVVLQCAETFDESLLSPFGERFELPFSGRSEENRVGHESRLETEFFQNGGQRFGPFLLRLG